MSNEDYENLYALLKTWHDGKSLTAEFENAFEVVIKELEEDMPDDE